MANFWKFLKNGTKRFRKERNKLERQIQEANQLPIRVILNFKSGETIYGTAQRIDELKTKGAVTFCMDGIEIYATGKGA